MKNRNIEHSDNWATPKDFYDTLDSEFHFDYDPCPLNGSGGLESEWGTSNFVNPPYSRKLKDAFVKKAIEESQGSVAPSPLKTSTVLFHDYIKPNAKEIRFVRVEPLTVSIQKGNVEREEGDARLNDCDTEIEKPPVKGGFF
ncbi:MAG: hypothetical protein IPO40_24690 [Fibrobacteres bacterium]|nr:hypothetical protein [Fibrobacterota bacterium]